MVDIQKLTIEEVLAKADKKDPESLLQYLFAHNVLDERRCKIALMRKNYFKLIRENPDLSPADARELTAEDFCVSIKTVEKAIYYHTRVEL